MKKLKGAQSVKAINAKCFKCNGKCWNPNSQTETQKNCKEMFGVIVNDCVNGQPLNSNLSNSLEDRNHGVIQCPYALGLLH